MSCLVRFSGRDTRPTRIRFLRRETKASGRGHRKIKYYPNLRLSSLIFESHEFAVELQGEVRTIGIADVN